MRSRYMESYLSSLCVFRVVSCVTVVCFLIFPRMGEYSRNAEITPGNEV